MNEQVEQLMFLKETYSGRCSTKTDYTAFSELLEKASFELIKYALEWCASRNHHSALYLKKVVESWIAEGIVTAEQAREYASQEISFAIMVERQLGNSTTRPSNQAIQMVKKWLADGWSEKMILLACDQAVIRSPFARLSYADAILEKWREIGITTPEQLQAFNKKGTKDNTHHESYTDRRRETVEVPIHEEKQLNYEVEGLLPCPFCGETMIGVQSQFSSKFHTNYLSIFCNRCGCRTRASRVDQKDIDNGNTWNNTSVDELVQLWNTRV